MNLNTIKPSKPVSNQAPANGGYRSTVSGAKAVAPTGTLCTSPDHKDIHRRHIAERAYFMAEKRQFSGGDPIQDWLIAEQSVCSPKR
jgi:hypothetical protein